MNEVKPNVTRIAVFGHMFNGRQFKVFQENFPFSYFPLLSLLSTSATETGHLGSRAGTRHIGFKWHLKLHLNLLSSLSLRSQETYLYSLRSKIPSNQFKSRWKESNSHMRTVI